MDKLKTICVCLFSLGLVAAITVCAIYFGRPALMWWYLAPALVVCDCF